MPPPSASVEVNFTVAEKPSSSKSVITASWFVCNSCHSSLPQRYTKSKDADAARGRGFERVGDTNTHYGITH